MENRLKLLEFCKNEGIPIHIVTESKDIVAADALVKSVCDEIVTVVMKGKERKVQLRQISSVGILFRK